MSSTDVPDDLSRLSSLEEDNVRYALSQRFDQSRIYTHINSLLVAINPYQLLPLYGQDALKAYNTYGQTLPGPHVFGVAAATYRGLLDARSQSVIISGESGAGKTEVQHRSLASALSRSALTSQPEPDRSMPRPLVRAVPVEPAQTSTAAPQRAAGTARAESKASGARFHILGTN